MSTDILIIDDEKDIRELVADILKDEGHETRLAQNSDAAIAALAERVPSAIVLDIWLQGSELDGLGILELVKERTPDVPVIMISGHGNIETAVSAIKIGAYDYIEKPFKAERLTLVVARALESARMRREIAELSLKTFSEKELIGDGSTIRQMRNMIERVASTGSRVLISGPAGSGKEVVGRLIHAQSKRAGGPFVVLNAASMDPARVEVELFGSEDPSNPVFGPRKIGTFERAHGGTLFIDEVADMPLETQAKILRVLQDQSFERVGGNRRVKVDVRVIAATNRDLQEETKAGRFREDLFYRLNVVPIRVPALKERREDIPAFCDYFLRRSSQLLGLPLKTIGEDAMAVLQTYEWPGNVRQLRNLMEWVLIMSQEGTGTTIHAGALPPELFSSNPAMMKPEVNADIMAMPLREARELFEKQYLLAQINRFGGNISKTSSFIGMERSALHRKLKLLGITTGDEKVTEAA